MTNSFENQLVTEVGRSVVQLVAPQELPLYRANSQNYLKDPKQALTDQADKDEMLGFGGYDAVVFLTPALLSLVTVVLQFVISEVKLAIKEESSSLIHEAVKYIFGKVRPNKGDVGLQIPTKLTVKQRDQAWQLAVNRALELGFSQAMARSMSDAVVGQLVVE